MSKNPAYDAFEKDIAMVKFYFEKSRVFQFQTKASNNWFDFLSQVGGNAGLGIGFSIISAMEIIDWITIRLIQNYLAGHIDVEARVGVPKSTIAETGMGVTSRP